jgi:hypothetical protein
MNSVGIDLHRRRSHIAAIDEDGREVLSRRIGNDPAVFLELLGGLEGESEVALEATYGGSGWSSCWRRLATRCISRTRCGRRRSRRRG